jgi:hypothetical protein
MAPAVAGRQPQDQPDPAHHGDRAAAAPDHRRPALLRPPGGRGQDTDRSHASAQAAAVRCGVPAIWSTTRSGNGPARVSRTPKREGRARKDTWGRLRNPARPARTPTPALRTSRFPGPPTLTLRLLRSRSQAPPRPLPAMGPLTREGSQERSSRPQPCSGRRAMARSPGVSFWARWGYFTGRTPGLASSVRWDRSVKRQPGSDKLWGVVRDRLIGDRSASVDA